MVFNPDLDLFRIQDALDFLLQRTHGMRRLRRTLGPVQRISVRGKRWDQACGHRGVPGLVLKVCSIGHGDMVGAECLGIDMKYRRRPCETAIGGNGCDLLFKCDEKTVGVLLCSGFNEAGPQLGQLATDLRLNPIVQKREFRFQRLEVDLDLR